MANQQIRPQDILKEFNTDFSVTETLYVKKIDASIDDAVSIWRLKFDNNAKTHALSARDLKVNATDFVPIEFLYTSTAGQLSVKMRYGDWDWLWWLEVPGERPTNLRFTEMTNLIVERRIDVPEPPEPPVGPEVHPPTWATKTEEILLWAIMVKMNGGVTDVVDKITPQTKVEILLKDLYNAVGATASQ